MTTIGDPDLNFSFGLGYGYVEGRLSSSPTINLSGTIRFTDGIALLTENYLIGGGDILAYRAPVHGSKTFV